MFSRSGWSAVVPSPRRAPASSQGVLETPTVEEIFRRHAHDVHRLITRLLGPGASRADIEDLGQQVFMAIHVALPKFRGESKVSTWVYGVTTRVVYREIRGRGRHRKMIERMRERAQSSEPPRQEASVELRQVWQHLLRIDAKKRIVFILHDIEGLSGPEIAEVVGIKVPTVHTRLFYARRELMRALEAQS